jgi:hypothetical protein
MSIVPCPQCGKRVSSRAAICGYCGFELGEVGEEDLQRFRERRLRDHIYRLNMASYAVMAAVIMVFAWFWVATGGFQMPVNSYGPYYLMLACGVAYLVVRVLLFRARRQKKENRRANRGTR